MPQTDVKLLLRELVDNWAIFSDAGDWEQFAECWHADGYLCTTWLLAPYAEFIAARQHGIERSVEVSHAHGGFRCQVRGSRALSQTRMTLTQRGEVHGVLVDVTCTGRFFDFHEEREGRWGMVRRQYIYEKDRMDALDPNAGLQLDAAQLAEYPAGYRYLAYLQSRLGYKVIRRGLPQVRGVELDKLYADGAAWLAGAAFAGRPIVAL